MAKNKKIETQTNGGTARLRNVTMTYNAIGMTPNPETVKTVNAKSEGKVTAANGFEDFLRKVSRRTSQPAAKTT